MPLYRFRSIAFDETPHWLERPEECSRVFGVYLFREGAVTYCCSLSPSSRVVFLENVFVGLDSEHSFVEENDRQGGAQYVPFLDPDRLPSRVSEAIEIEIDDEDEDAAWEDALEYARGNPPYFLDWSNFVMSLATKHTQAVVKIQQDSDPEDPREHDNVGRMFCRHRRYWLGDKDAENPYIEEGGKEIDGRWLNADRYVYACAMLRTVADNLENEGALWQTEAIHAVVQQLEHAQWDRRAYLRNDIAICLPLYLYDHSGLTISHSRFPCRWDSGQVGWHYLTCAKLADAFGGDEARALACLNAELTTYDLYLRCDVWGFVIEDEEGAFVGSRWGFCGDRLEDTGMLDHVDPQYQEALRAAWNKRFNN